ncbi:hypothetical protein ACA910_014857 [Epithemia clementina (nom. ined.)]
MLESWRPDRDEDGGRMTTTEVAFLCKDKGLDLPILEPTQADQIPPVQVRPVARFADDVKALQILTQMADPPKIRVRPSISSVTALMFGDASGAGFGSSLWIQGSTTIDAKHGTWTRTYSETSSNFWEFHSLVSRLERLSEEGQIKAGSELFIFTDNSTTESAFYCGTSKSKLHFDLVLRLHRLEMQGQLFINVIWIAGTRMIEQGTDGLSRGDLLSGVLAGKDMLDFVPLHRSAEERHPGLVQFLMGTMHALFPALHLDPSGWFDNAFKPGNYVWTPPPSIALEALEQLCESKQVRPKWAHIYMANRWRKKLGRIADVIFSIPTGTEVWDRTQHEPLIVGLIFPLLNCRPWQVKRDRARVDNFVLTLQGLWVSGSPAV